MTTMFDTLGLARAREKAGVAPEQARDMVAALASYVEGSVAGQQDVAALRAELEHLRLDVLRAIADSKVSMVQWFAGIMVGSVIALVAANFAMLRLLLP